MPEAGAVQVLLGTFEAYSRERAEGGAPLFTERSFEAAFSDELLAQLYTPDAVLEVEIMPGIPETYSGFEGIRTFWRQWLEAWDDLEYDAPSVVEEADRFLIWVPRQTMRGRTSGLRIEWLPYGWLGFLRDGLIERLVLTADRERIAAGGFEPPAA